MNLPFHIAGRYLFARKSHNVINIISAISAAGMAVGTAALIIILSVYNGFDALVQKSLSDVDPDILVTPAEGKLFRPDSTVFDWVYGEEKVSTMYGVLQDRVFVSVGGQQAVAIAKGLDPDHALDSPLRDHLQSGVFQLERNQIDQCVMGASLAYSLGVNVRGASPVQIYYPVRGRNISMANPMGSLNSSSVMPVGTVSVNSEMDAQLVILPYRTMQHLLGTRDEVTGVEIRLRRDCTRKDVADFVRELKDRLGKSCIVKDRYEQNEAVFRMMKYEKVSTFLILLFVVIIIAFNIFGSLLMLIIEKKEDIATLYALGASRSLVRRIFVLEGWMVSLLGMGIGLAVGLLLSWLQMRFGLIPMPGSFVADSYPVVIDWFDVLCAVVGVAAVGYIVAILPLVGHTDYE